MMIRKQLLMTPEDIKIVEATAKVEGRSFSSQVREMVRKYPAKRKDKP